MYQKNFVIKQLHSEAQLRQVHYFKPPLDLQCFQLNILTKKILIIQ